MTPVSLPEPQAARATPAASAPQASYSWTFAQNAAALYAVQISNWILPLITLPFVLRVLGPSQYGRIAFVQSLSMCFYVLLDYGFSVSATRKVALERDDAAKLSATACSIWGAQILLAMAGLALVFILAASVPRLAQVRTLVLLMYGYAFGKALFPAWLFKGLERMAFIPAANLIVQLLVVTGIFTLIRGPQDYLVYAGLLSLGALGTAVLGIVLAVRLVRVRLHWPRWRAIAGALSEGWVIFLSQLPVALGTLNAFIVGLMASDAVVGYYSAAEKIVGGVTNLLYPIAQAAYPSFSRIAIESQSLLRRRGRKMLLLAGILSIGFAVILLAGAPWMIEALFGSEYGRSIAVLRILAIVPFLSVISQVSAFQIMLPLKMDRTFAGILFGGGILGVMLQVILVPAWQENGMAMAVLFSGLTVCTAMLFVGTRRLQALQATGIS